MNSIANELITRGWTKGGLVGRDGSVCLVGAVNCAFFGKPRAWEAGLDVATEDVRDRYNAARSAVFQAVLEAGGPNVADWNDNPDRTFDEVLRVAKEADAILSEQ